MLPKKKIEFNIYKNKFKIKIFMNDICHAQIFKSF